MTNEKNSNEEIKEENNEETKTENKVDSNSDRIKNLIELGMSNEQITSLFNKGLTLDQIEDYCNNKMNQVLDKVMKQVLKAVADRMKNYNFFPITDDHFKENAKAKSDLHVDCAKIFKSADILFKDINTVYQTINDLLFNTFTDSQNNFNNTKNNLLAKLLGRELPIDITVNDVDKKHKEVFAKK